MEIDWKAQLGQDRFVVDVLGGKRDGTYVDIGAGHPTDISNTYVLETRFAWRGVLCEKDPSLLAEIMRRRAGNEVSTDALAADWHSLFSKIAKDGWIDYLSLDLEPPDLTLEVLRRLPLGPFKFRVATVEHDAYRDGGHRRMMDMASIMYSHGYQCVGTAQMKVDGELLSIEDWWVHEELGITLSKQEDSK